jgi:hypothetical protein
MLGVGTAQCNQCNAMAAAALLPLLPKQGRRRRRPRSDGRLLFVRSARLPKVV